MAKATAKKVTAKPAPARAAAGGDRRAAAAAQHQGRAAEPAPQRNPGNSPGQQRNVPAVTRSAPPMDPTTMANVPAHMRADMDAGKSAIGHEDMEIPRLKLMQGTSKELENYNELRSGNFFHTAAEEIFAEPFRAVVIFMERKYLLWRPLESGGGILARADDGVHWSPSSGEFEVKLDKKDGGHTVKWRVASTVEQSGLAKWGTMNPNDPNSPPAATLMWNYVLAFPDQPDLMPAVLTFQRTSIKEARRLNTKIKTVRTPLFGSIYEFASYEDNNAASQRFYNISVRGAGLVEDENLYEQYKALHQQFVNIGLNIKDIESTQEDTVHGDETGDEGSGRPPI